MSRANARASTSPSTPNAPTTCEFSRGAIPRGRAQNYGPGTYPAMHGPSRGLQRKLGPLFYLFGRHGVAEAGAKSTLAPMVNRVLTSPYLWWFDPFPAGLNVRAAAPRVLALQSMAMTASSRAPQRAGSQES